MNINVFFNERSYTIKLKLPFFPSGSPYDKAFEVAALPPAALPTRDCNVLHLSARSITQTDN
jgi:hypothetical protein